MVYIKWEDPTNKKLEESLYFSLYLLGEIIPAVHANVILVFLSNSSLGGT